MGTTCQHQPLSACSSPRMLASPASPALARLSRPPAVFGWPAPHAAASAARDSPHWILRLLSSPRRLPLSVLAPLHPKQLQLLRCLAVYRCSSSSQELATVPRSGAVRFAAGLCRLCRDLWLRASFAIVPYLGLPVACHHGAGSRTQQSTHGRRSSEPYYQRDTLSATSSSEENFKEQQNLLKNHVRRFCWKPGRVADGSRPWRTCTTGTMAHCRLRLYSTVCDPNASVSLIVAFASHLFLLVPHCF